MVYKFDNLYYEVLIGSMMTFYDDSFSLKKKFLKYNSINIKYLDFSSNNKKSILFYFYQIVLKLG